MYVFEELFANRIMWVGVLAWFVAQAIKVLLALIREKRFRYQLFFSLGGMPSSHSAIVSALSASIGLVNGFNSSEFAISFVVAVVVMTDAAGVRRAAGKQARNEGKRALARPAPALRQGAVFVILNTVYARGPKRAARRRAGPGRGAHGAQRRRAQKGETL